MQIFLSVHIHPVKMGCLILVLISSAWCSIFSILIKKNHLPLNSRELFPSVKLFVNGVCFNKFRG